MGSNEAATADLAAENARTMAALEEAERRLRVVQGRQLVVNLDDAWREHRERDKPIVFRFEGGEYEVPSSMPAEFGRFYRRHCLHPEKDKATGRETVTFRVPIDERFFDFVVAAIGQEFADAVMATRIPLAVVYRSVIAPVLREWGLFVSEESESSGPEDAEKKSRTPDSSPGPGGN